MNYQIERDTIGCFPKVRNELFFQEDHIVVVIVVVRFMEPEELRPLGLEPRVPGTVKLKTIETP